MRRAALAISILIAGIAAARAQSVTVIGQVVKGHCTSFNSNTVIKDAGFACPGGLPSLPLASTQIFIGSLAGLAVAQTLSGTGDCSVSLANNGVATFTCTKSSGTAFGTAAFQNTGTSGATIPFLNGNNTYSGSANFTGTFQIGGFTQTFPGAAATLTQTIASGALALATGAIASATCTAAQTATATGTSTTDTIVANFNGDPTGVTGFVPLATGMLVIIDYPTANTVNFKVCNNTGASITPGAITVNWRVVR